MKLVVVALLGLAVGAVASATLLTSREASPDLLPIADSRVVVGRLDVDGHVIDRDALGERVLLIVFAARWSQPSLELLRETQRLAHEVGPEWLATVAVVESHDARAIRDELSLDLPVVPDREPRLAQALSVRGIPSSILLDARGSFVWLHEGYASRQASTVRAMVLDEVAQERARRAETGR